MTDKTMTFRIGADHEDVMKETLTEVFDALQEKGSVWSPWNEHTRRSEPQRRANSNGSTSHEEWKYHVVYAGAVHIGNYSRCVHRPGGDCACQKASVHRILE